MVADGKVFVVGQKRLFRTEELADASSVVDGGVEVRVIGDVNWPAEGRAGDGVEGGFCRLSAVGLLVNVEERRSASRGGASRCDGRGPGLD